MASIKSVAVLGGTGNIGKVIVERLVAANSFDVSIITREASSATSRPPGVALLTADYVSRDSLVASFRSFDAVVCALPAHLEELQHRCLDAAIEAGVRRYVPSEFGLDHRRPAVKSMPLARSKVQLHEALTAAADAGKIEYTSIVGGAWPEFILGFEGAMCVAKRKFHIHDGGDLSFSMTTKAAYGDAVAGALKKPSETKNKFFAIESICLSQNQIMDLVRQVLPNEQLEIVHVSTEERYQKAIQKLFSGDASDETIQTIVLRAAFDPDMHHLPDTMSEVLGVRKMTEVELKDIIVSLAGQDH